MIIYRENIVSNRVSDAAARQRNTNTPSIVKNGSIVCVSPRCDPTWVSQCLALRVYFSTSLLWLIWSIHGNCCGLYCSLCTMTEVDLRYDEIEWEESSDGIFIYVLQCTKSEPNWVAGSSDNGGMTQYTGMDNYSTEIQAQILNVHYWTSGTVVIKDSSSPYQTAGQGDTP